MKFAWVEILLIVVIILLVAQFPIRIIYGDELREFDQRVADSIGVSREILGLVGASLALSFLAWHQLRKRRKAKRHGRLLL